MSIPQPNLPNLRQMAHEIEENVRSHSGVILERHEAVLVAMLLRELDKCRRK